MSKYGYNVCMSIPNSPTSIDILKTRTISKRGGARIGAGRKPKLQFEARELFNMAVDQRWPRIEKKMDEWIDNGDKDMVRFLIEQRIGKPSQSIDIEKKETRVFHNIIYKPEVREALKVFEDKIKNELMKNIISKRNNDEDEGNF